LNKEIEKPEVLPRKEDLSAWFDAVIKHAGIADFDYPLKGCGVWLEYGWKIRNNVIELMRELLEETGHKEMYFPFLIPEDVFRKESEFIKGFENQVYWVTHGGLKPLKVKLVIRPTSETPIYHMFAKWIKSKSDLPLKVWQVVSVFRYETKATRPLIRVREITTFKEAHTAHATAEDAEKQIREAVEIYKKFFDELGIPYLINKRPEYDKFPGAVYTIAFDTILPDGRILQIGTVHNLGQNFSKAFDIKYRERDREIYVYQTCYGISERVIASIIMHHGDDFGLVLPPRIAPIQIIVIPIFTEEGKENVIEYANKIVSILNKKFRVSIDVRDITPGRKFYDWDLRGVPLRVEIGMRELETSSITVVRRDTHEKMAITVDEKLIDVISKLLDSITKNLKERAWKRLLEKIYRVNKFIDLEGGDAISKLLDEETGEFKGGVVEIPVCGDKDYNNPRNCERIISKYIDVLGEPFDVKGDLHGVHCSICGKRAERIIRIGRTY